MSNSYVLIAGAICLTTALIEAWVILARFSSEEGPVARLFPGSRDLLRSHIDYLMMAQFLFVFYGLARLLGLSFPDWTVATLCIGSFLNPFGFLIRSVLPHDPKSPPKLFLGVMILSCVATTLGYLSATWVLVGVALTG